MGAGLLVFTNQVQRLFCAQKGRCRLDFDRQGVHVGHYFMENYEAAKQDFAVRAGLVERQRLFSDEQLAVIRNACAFALEDDATLSYAEEKQLQSVQEQIELLLPQQTQEQRPTMEQTM